MTAPLLRSLRTLRAPFLALALLLALANGVLSGVAHASPTLLCVGERVERGGDPPVDEVACPVVLSALGVLAEPEAAHRFDAPAFLRVSGEASSAPPVGFAPFDAKARAPPVRS